MQQRPIRRGSSEYIMTSTTDKSRAELATEFAKLDREREQLVAQLAALSESKSSRAVCEELVRAVQGVAEPLARTNTTNPWARAASGYAGAGAGADGAAGRAQPVGGGACAVA